jgi:subfamily B ATP-binding cassette protein MsbA
MAKKIKFKLYRQVLAYARPYRRRIALSMLASLVVGGTDAALAKMVEPFVDRMIVAGDKSMVTLAPLVVIALGSAKAVFRFIQNYFIKTAGQLAIQDMRNNVFGHNLSLSMRFHASYSSGDKLSRILNDINMLSRSLSESLVNALREGFTLIALIAVAFYTDWQMAAIAFLVVPVLVLPVQAISRSLRKYTRRAQESISVLTVALEQAFSGIKIIKVFGSEDKTHYTFREKNSTYYKNLRKGYSYDSLSAATVEIVTSFGVAAVLWLGLSRVASGEMTQGALFSIVAAVVMMFAPIKRLTNVNNVMQMAMASAERVFELMEHQPEISDAVDAKTLETVRGDLQFDDVTFYYNGTDELPAIKNLSLNINAGEVVALVGPSGAGKTTLAALLCRFYDPDTGTILLDGTRLQDISSVCLHRNVTMVDQEAFLFNDTVMNNIRYGRKASDEEVHTAAGKAYAAEFIERLPDGYDTIIGDRGLRLSGGQRQRISIARAICQDAPVLILDEATSALDTESEAIVQQAMGNLMQGRTTIVIAHRLSTIMNADRIVVMEAGEVVEIGTHAELLSQGGLYKKLYDMQFKD